MNPFYNSALTQSAKPPPWIALGGGVSPELPASANTVPRPSEPCRYTPLTGVQDTVGNKNFPAAARGSDRD